MFFYYLCNNRKYKKKIMCCVIFVPTTKRRQGFVEETKTLSGSTTDTTSTCRPIKNNDEDTTTVSTTCNDNHDEKISISSSLSSVSSSEDVCSSSSAKCRRMVRFADDNVIHGSSSSLCSYVMDDTVLANGWYNRHELYNMKHTSHRIGRNFIKKNHIPSSSLSSLQSSLWSPENDGHPNDNSPTTTLKRTSGRFLFALKDDTVRGLETMICSERRRRRYLTRQFVLTAANKLQLHQHHHHATTLAWVTARVTQYATQIALIEAINDASCIHHVTATTIVKL
jgi:hypothetical protein